MTTMRRFHMNDLFKMSNINLDSLTETYHNRFYMHYMTYWPTYFEAAEDASGNIVGYSIGKDEGSKQEYHGHISAVTVNPTYRRLGLAQKFMQRLEESSIRLDTYFVDLFVRASNHRAINMYKKFGYVVYRRVLGYYSGDDPEDGLDMRKAMPLDKDKRSVIPLTKPILPEELEFN
eukprot:179385_1